MLDFDKDLRCMGCSACAAVCAKGAIAMEQSAKGFYVPVISEETCTSCGLCEGVCPALAEDLEKRDISALACEYAYVLDDALRMQSTSGGVFFALARDVLNRGGLVCGCVWDEGFVARHVLTEDPETVMRMRGSKYVQSDMGECFRQIKAAVKTREVLFSGTPCQTTALHRLVGHSENLLTCGLICGGVPSPKVWRKYVRALEKAAGSRMTEVHMRSKAGGWYVPQVKARFANGKVVWEVLLTENLYGTNFNFGLTVADVCLNCGCKLDRMEADLVIGDHWGIDPKTLTESGNKGMSVVIPLTPAGEKAFARIRGGMRSRSGKIGDVDESHTVLMKNHRVNNRRQEFFASLDQEDILPLMARCLPEGLKRSMPLRKFLHRRRLYIPLFTLRFRYMSRRGLRP